MQFSQESKEFSSIEITSGENRYHTVMIDIIAVSSYPFIKKKSWKEMMS